MTADLTAIRALLASTSRFTDGPWIALEYAANDAAVAVAETDEDKHEHPGALIVGQTDAHDASLIAAAPTLHAHLTELVGEVERLQDENGHFAALVKASAWETSLAVAPLNAELERLRAHNARMAAFLDMTAECMPGLGNGYALDAAIHKHAGWVSDAYKAKWVRRLAAGEVDDA